MFATNKESTVLCIIFYCPSYDENCVRRTQLSLIYVWKICSMRSKIY